MKVLTMITALICLMGLGLKGQNAAEKTKADLAWESVPKFIYKGAENDKFEYEKAYELYLRDYLNAGLKFWDEFPDDKRRTIWFYSMMSSCEPWFWKNIDEGAKALSATNNGFYLTDIDVKLFNSWEKRRLQLIKNILDDVHTTDIEKQALKQFEIGLELKRSQNAKYRINKKQFISRLEQLFKNAALNVKEENAGYVTIYAEQLFLAMEHYGLELNDFENLFNSLDHPKYAGIQKWVSQKQAILELRNKPFELQYETVGGKQIDIASLRGKVVLIDFWSTACSECIERMPAIKQVYDKYKDKGFTVISAAYNPEIDKEKILTIYDKIGADWPLMIIGGNSEKPGLVNPNSIGKQIWQKYGFSYVPQLLLLDKQGKLIMYNAALKDGDFEPLVKEQLAK